MDHTLTDALEAMRLCEAEGDPYAKLCVVEIERLRTRVAELEDETIRQRETEEKRLSLRFEMRIGSICRVIDDVISESDPDLRDSLMIQLGASGLLSISR